MQSAPTSVAQEPRQPSMKDSDSIAIFRPI